VVRRHLLLTLTLLCCSLALAAWSAGALGTATPSGAEAVGRRAPDPPSSAATPAAGLMYLPAVLGGFPKASPTPTATNSVFDDFSDPGSGWSQEDTVEYLRGYADGEYRVLVKEPNMGAGAVCPRFRCTNCSLEVDARYATGNYYAYGLTFGVTDDEESSYFFLVYEEGYYAIWKMIGGQFEAIIDYTASEYIRRGQSTNRLRVVRVGQEIRTFINGHHIITVPDNTIMGSLRVGLVAGASDLPNVDVRFDNFYAAPHASGSE
jgi:hypothetical protein